LDFDEPAMLNQNFDLVDRALSISNGARAKNTNIAQGDNGFSPVALYPD
jgi:hypothetical protein